MSWSVQGEPTRPADREKRLAAKIVEGDHGWWYAVFEGEGDMPGSLRRAASAFPSFAKAADEAASAVAHEIEVRACEHVWEPLSSVGSIEKCSECKTCRPAGGGPWP